MLKFTAALAASRGARSKQEDAAALWPGPSTAFAPFAQPAEEGQLVAVLADGMGGHAGGTLASRIACESFLTAYAQQMRSEPVRDRLRAGLHAANRAMAKEVETNKALHGMGSTLIGAHFEAEFDTQFGGGGVSWISVGDSPLYLWREGAIALVNEDHSLAPLLDEMVRVGKLSAEAARNDHRRHMLRSAVTGEDFELVDLCAKPLALVAGDCVLLASDGIHSLETREIARIVAGYAKDGPQAIADALVRGVDNMRDPHQDNFTVAVVQVEGAEAPAPQAGASPL